MYNMKLLCSTVTLMHQINASDETVLLECLVNFCSYVLLE